jgi:hypothetical protein
MKIHIPQEIIDLTVCHNQYNCISNGEKCGTGPICNVIYPFSDKALFVKPDLQNCCPHNKPWGNWETCHCPVRVYLYKEYHI